MISQNSDYFEFFKDTTTSMLMPKVLLFLSHIADTTTIKAYWIREFFKVVQQVHVSKFDVYYFFNK